MLLRCVEMYGRMKRSISVLKMRGPAHDPALRGFLIDGNGMNIRKPCEIMSGILSGNPVAIKAQP